MAWPGPGGTLELSGELKRHDSAEAMPIKREGFVAQRGQVGADLANKFFDRGQWRFFEPLRSASILQAYAFNVFAAQVCPRKEGDRSASSVRKAKQPKSGRWSRPESDKLRSLFLHYGEPLRTATMELAE
jgi:hypothetical protein